MQHYYSKSTGGFYIEVHGSYIPSDAVPVSAEEYEVLKCAPSQGKVVQPDSNGRPVAVVRPPLSEDEQAMADAVAAEAQLAQLAILALPVILQFILGDETAKTAAKAALQPLADEAAVHGATISRAEDVRKAGKDVGAKAPP